jgi:hypothetical protein
MQYIALLETKNAPCQGYSNLSFNQALQLLNELVDANKTDVKEALILEDDDGGVCKVIASIRILK